MELTFHPLTPERWDDLEALFGRRGACGGCWCMYWRLKRSEFEQHKGEGNRQALKALVEGGQVPGLLAYADSQPVGWVSLGRREEFPTLGRSRVLKVVDEQPLWSVVCFYVAKGYRRRGITLELLKAALAYARQQGARLVEGYPVEPRQGRLPDPFVYTGLVSTFRQAGFEEVIRRSPTRPIMRRFLDEGGEP